jgi:hypothetical protein
MCVHFYKLFDFVNIMSLHITIDSLRGLPIDKIGSIFTKIGNSITSYMLEEGRVSDDLYFDFNINQLKIGYKKIKIGDELINEQCSICLEKFQEGEYKRELNCSHTYHKKCIDKWIKHEFNCPECRCSDL